VVIEPDGDIDVIVGTSDRSHMEVDCPPAEQPVIDTAAGEELVRLSYGRKLIPMGWPHARDG
jgi:hypothetical protein